MIKINVLGTEYYIIYKEQSDDEMLEKCDGYTDKTAHKIVVTLCPKDNQLEQWNVYQKKVLRHEIIHAFLFESGLHGNANYDAVSTEHPEMMVDWFAVQYEKLTAAFKEAQAI